MRYLALLRGVNVGGSAAIRMADLRDCAAGLGFEEVATYIASGNLLFRSRERSATRLESQLETAIRDRFGFPVSVVVRSGAEVRRIVERIPAHWLDAAELRVTVAFLLRGADGAAIARQLRPKDGIDELAVAPGALLIATRRDALTRTGIRLIGTPPYKLLTARNLNTTLELAELLGR
ncbi:MAG TPA: DUF1697 domain-containing protein [Gaiellaceae bacterium]|nr:DUF1697 domain-containing protein [Gaiellaceae bacterium]